MYELLRDEQQRQTGHRLEIIIIILIFIEILLEAFDVRGIGRWLLVDPIVALYERYRSV